MPPKRRAAGRVSLPGASAPVRPAGGRLRVLLVAGDEGDAAQVRGLAAKVARHLELERASTFGAGFEAMMAGGFDAHVVACQLGPREGLDLLRAYREAGGLAPVILLSNRPDRTLDVAAMENGAADFLVKDRLDAGRLERSVRYAVAHRRREVVLRRAREELQSRVLERTVALETTNAALGAEVTERRRAEHALREVDRRKNEFLATLAHELRNPLAPIRHAVEILCREAPSQQAGPTGALVVIERQVRHLVRLIDDLLDVSRIMHGKLDLQRQPILVSEVVESALEATRPLLLARQQELQVTVPVEPLWLSGDPVRLTQILTNLLSNAVRYTEDGGLVRVDASQEGRGVAIRVIDSGVGISELELAHIFTMFGQAARDRASALAGLGIGLALAKRLTEMHGGTLTAASEGRGAGSTFTLRLPLGSAPVGAAAVPANAEGVARTAGRGPRRVLVVDDNLDAASTLAELLSLDGHQTFVAHDGPSAIAEAERANPDVVVLDIGLPGFDGFEVARRLRKMPASNGVRLVALSGWVQPEDRERLRAAGFDHHLAKPVDLATLRGLLEA